MADPKNTYLTNIALVQQRAGDRSINLDDLDPSRRNTRTVSLMAVERMKTNLLTKPLAVSVDAGGWITESLTGTKDGVNTVFTFPNSPSLGSLTIYYNGQALERVSASPLQGQFTISEKTVTLGFAPDAAAPNSLIGRYLLAV